MRRHHFAKLLTLGLLLFPVAVLADDATGHARLHQIDQSDIQAHIFFVDNGSTLFVLGVATGLDPLKTYISLVYGEGSVPGGPHACEPSGTLNRAQMFVGAWTVSADGTGVLTAKKTGPAYVPVSKAGTVSVRHLISAGPPPVAPLQACGEVAVNPL